ncbi:Na/Pi cotransporter family protein [Sphingobacterium chuzhouense]|uniref:Na/Pi cotransporter family protein n=1 Tax=Sphingobacterium chuzhouense TaxID=1742264 RepID=A0ABR7XUJ7_9SPHI|nr:Na/Pi symporter [Sphingobacterium chuzhouense]MBD1422730.1 Na/Pi cotransporter family protein [Sphingobacterium chuzhouense]
MEELQTLMVIISAIALFIYGLQSFSKEIEHFGEEKLSKWIGKLTKWKFGSFALGAVVTGIIQSSTFVSSLTVSLVNTGIITFRDSLLILLGTNIGTTATAWIVSFQSSLLGPFFIVLGTLVSMIPGKVAVAGKSIFYFGFIFFALALIGDAMQPVKDDPVLVDILAKASSPIMGIFYGIVITVIVQSSSVVVGLVIVLISQGTIDLSAAIPIVIGANIGTTSTALIISLRFSPMSRLVALSASLFNVVGVLLMFPFFGVLENVAISFSSIPALQVAIAFTISNTVTSLFFYVFLSPTMAILRNHRWYKEATMDLE